MTSTSSKSPERIFVSHNSADKAFARALSFGLAEQGVSVWFDEWKMRPGDSLIEGIESGLADVDCFALIWSKAASASKWVGTEVRAYVRRRVDDGSLRIVPIMLDDTPLPLLVAEYFGIRSNGRDAVEVAAKIVGDTSAHELARRLQERFFDLLDEIGQGVGPWHYRLCPRCGSTKLEGQQQSYGDDQCIVVKCKECGWEDASEV